jgi:glycogen debranching enzyme
MAMSELAAARNQMKKSVSWRARAESLREAIEQQFWSEHMNFYALAIDGDGQSCEVRASNAGHLLFCGVPRPERAAAVTEQLLCERFCSGWGIRTLAEGEARYNPMAYHNGSVWPHDTSLCVAGIARYGARARVVQLLSEVFEAANQFSMRLPELFCGFRRVAGEGPTPYPVACLPQAWASGSIFMLLQASLGVRIDGRRGELHIERPQLPNGIESLAVRDLRVGGRSIDIQFQRIGAEVVALPAGRGEGEVPVLAHL